MKLHLATIGLLLSAALLVTTGCGPSAAEKQQRAQFQQVVREEAAQSDVDVRSMVTNWQTLPMEEMIPRIDKVVEERQKHMVKAESINLSFAPDLRKEYVSLLASENEVFAAEREQTLRNIELLAKFRGGTDDEILRAREVSRHADAAVIASLDAEIESEKKFQEVSSAEGVVYSPVFTPHKAELYKAFGKR